MTLDLYSRLQSVASAGAAAREEKKEGSEAEEAGAAPDRFRLASHAAFLDAARLHERLLRRKRQRGWHNLVIERGTVERLLQNDDWYELRLPPERLSPAGFRQLRALEDVALDLVTEYADRFWRRERRRWEHDRIEVVTLDEDDPNHLRAWKLSVDAAGDKLAEDARKLADALREGRFDDLMKYWYDTLKVGLVPNKAHAYKPLLYVDKDCAVTVEPVPLDGNEKRVVDHLESLAARRHACLRGRELYLIRNRTRGRGVSFFDDFGYYPDFIVWLKDDARQHVLFLDPQGVEPLRRPGAQKGGAAPRDREGRRPGAQGRSEPALTRLRPVRDPGRRDSTTASAPRAIGSGTASTSSTIPTGCNRSSNTPSNRPPEMIRYGGVSPIGRRFRSSSCSSCRSRSR